MIAAAAAAVSKSIEQQQVVARWISRMVNNQTEDALELELSMTQQVVDDFDRLIELDPGNSEKYAAELAVYEKKVDDLLKRTGEVELRKAKEKKLREELLRKENFTYTKMKAKTDAFESVQTVEEACKLVMQTSRADENSIVCLACSKNRVKSDECQEGRKKTGELTQPRVYRIGFTLTQLKIRRYQDIRISKVGTTSDGFATVYHFSRQSGADVDISDWKDWAEHQGIHVSPSMEEFLISYGTLKNVPSVLPLATSVVTFDQPYISALQDACWMLKEYGYSLDSIIEKYIDLSVTNAMVGQLNWFSPDLTNSKGHGLTKNDVLWQWLEDHRKAFDEVKTHLRPEPVIKKLEQRFNDMATRPQTIRTDGGPYFKQEEFQQNLPSVCVVGDLPAHPTGYQRISLEDAEMKSELDYG